MKLSVSFLVIEQLLYWLMSYVMVTQNINFTINTHVVGLILQVVDHS